MRCWGKYVSAAGGAVQAVAVIPCCAGSSGQPMGSPELRKTSCVQQRVEYGLHAQ